MCQKSAENINFRCGTITSMHISNKLVPVASSPNKTKNPSIVAALQDYAHNAGSDGQNIEKGATPA